MAWYIRTAPAHLVGASRDQKEDEMKYLLDAIFLAISACLYWVVWDATASNILSQRVFPTVALAGVLILADIYLHTLTDD